MNKIKFGTGGFRGIIGDDFNKENLQNICQAIANIIEKTGKKREICIGYDNRFLSEESAIWCSEVFAGNNINVKLFDRATTTPVVMYATMVNNNDYGVMITASHNPHIYNGIKVFTYEGKDANEVETNLIEKEMQQVSQVKTLLYSQAHGTKITLVNYIDEYLNNIVSLLELENVGKNLNIIYDAMYGSSTEEIKLLSQKIDSKNYKIINSSRDAFFGFKVPAPSQNNIQELTKTVLKNKASIGFALDADGDRLAVVDENGNYIDNNYILAISYYFFAKYCNQKGNSVKNLATSNLLDKVTQKFGYKCIEVPVGFKHVSNGIITNQAIIGGESSGGLAIKGHIWGKDSLLAIAICIKAISVINKPFGEILKEVKDFVGGYEKVIFDKQYSYTSEQRNFIDKTLFIDKILPTHRYELEKIAKTANYVKVYYKNGNWSLIRFSGTEPILRIFVESDSQEENETMIKDWEEVLKLL